MHKNRSLVDRIRQLENLLDIAERKSDVLTSLLMEANAEYEVALDRISRSEQNFRAIFETAPEPIYLIDVNTGRILDCNDFTTAWLGYSKEELTSADADSILDTGSGACHGTAATAACCRQGAVAEWRFCRKDGSIAVAEVGGTPLEYKGRQCFAVLAHDITERKRAEEAIRRSEATFRAIFDSMNDAVLIQDLETGDVVDVNKRVCEDLGLTHEEARKLKLADLAGEEPPYTAETALAYHRRAAGGEPIIFEWGAKVKGGKTHWVEVSLRKAVIDGEPRILAVVRDLTERKKAEDEQERLRMQLFQAQKMEALGTLSGGIAHDFNNMLTIILGYSELCLADTDKDNPCCQDLAKIIETSQKAAELVKRLLTFSKQTPANLRPVDLNAEIAQFETLLSRTIPKMIQIELVLSDGLASIQADPVQIDQILMNLAINAKDAMPDGGRLTIGTRNLSLDEEYAGKHLGMEPGDYVCVTVSDTGHGMDCDTVARIFEPFFTTKGRDSRKGTGLGLAVVKGIVEQHGGHISCYSEPGVGTTFRMYFPAIAGERATKALEKDEIASGTETILLVDDEQLVLDLGCRILGKAGYTVITAPNGKKALERYSASRENIGLVILDLIMPEMGGKQCLETLLNMDPQVKAVIASGYAATEDGDQAFVKGAKAFVSKPYDMRELLRTVRHVLDEA